MDLLEICDYLMANTCGKLGLTKNSCKGLVNKHNTEGCFHSEQIHKVVSSLFSGL